MQAVWHVERDTKAKRATIVVELLAAAGKMAPAVEAEAGRAVRFLHPGAAAHDARLSRLGRRH